MKPVLLFNCLFFISIASYSQRSPLNTDSLLKGIAIKNANAIGKPFPSFIINGSSQYSTEKLKGKVVFINFWFASCVPCMAEMPALNKLYDKFKTDTNFVFLSLTFEQPDEIDRIRSKYNMQYPIASITRPECYRLNNENGFPTSIIINKKGITQYIRNGLPSYSEMDNNFKKDIYPVIEKNL